MKGSDQNFVELNEVNRGGIFPPKAQKFFWLLHTQDTQSLWVVTIFEEVHRSFAAPAISFPPEETKTFDPHELFRVQNECT